MSIPPQDPPPGNWPPPPSVTPPGPDGGVTQDDKTMALIAYIGGLLGSFLVPLIVYFVKKDQSRFVAFHAMQALILHAVVFIGYILSSFLTVLVIGFLMYPVFGILSLVFSIIAALAANRGEWYEIPGVGPFARKQVGM